MPEGLAAANAAGPLLSASMSVPASTTASLFLNNTSVVSPSPPSRTRTRLRSHAFCSQPLYVQLAWAVLRCHKPHGPGPTAAPVSIDPYVVASRHETVFEGSQVKGARRRRCRDAQGGGREDLLCVDAHHKALDKEASRDRGRGARADPRQALQERSDA